MCGATEFHLFLSAGAASGASTQMGLEVDDLEAAVAELRRRGVAFERFAMPPGIEVRDDGVIEVPGNYPSKGTGELGIFFRDVDGNLIGLGQATGPRA